jgi:drug/metabolite transporter (DMT)-like permease
MKKTTIIETVLVIGLIGLMALLFDPFHLSMNYKGFIFLSGLIAGVYFVLVSFIWGEGMRDERDQEHRFFASRYAYLTGSMILILGIVYQSTTMHVDPWLPGALSAMFVAKLFSRIYSEKYR